MSGGITALGIIVPAHDEAELLGRCLRSIARARARVAGDVHTCLVVVLDACCDGSRRVAERAQTLPFAIGEIDDHNVGIARAHGARMALSRLTDHGLDRTWLVTTDADCEVPTTWLADHVALANRGAHAIAGTVSIRDWSGHPAGRARAFERFYADHNRDGAHAHVHGANFGVRADAYTAVGGFAPLATGEDHALRERLLQHGYKVIASREISVATSSRLHGRAPNGFAGFLAQVES